jgi:monothiol glutaredoxin
MLSTKAVAGAVGALLGSYVIWKSASALKSNERQKHPYLENNTGSKEYLSKLIGKDKIVVFMKGSPGNPKCRYTRRLVDIFKEYGLEDYATYNVLEDPEMKQGIKEYSNWPTFPQVFFKRQFIGGIDKIAEMHKTGELGEKLRNIGVHSKLAERQELLQLGMRTSMLERHRPYRKN